MINEGTETAKRLSPTHRFVKTVRPNLHVLTTAWRKWKRPPNNPYCPLVSSPKTSWTHTHTHTGSISKFQDENKPLRSLIYLHLKQLINNSSHASWWENLFESLKCIDSICAWWNFTFRHLFFFLGLEEFVWNLRQSLKASPSRAPLLKTHK